MSDLYPPWSAINPKRMIEGFAKTQVVIETYLKNNGDNGDDPLYVADGVKKFRRNETIRIILEWMLSVVLFILIRLIVIVLYVPAKLFGLLYREVVFGKLGDMFPFERVDSYSYELYNRKGRLFPLAWYKGRYKWEDGSYEDPDNRRSCSYGCKLKGFEGKWEELSLRSEASKPETDEMLITEYILSDPIEHVLVSTRKVKVYFMGLHIHSRVLPQEVLHIEAKDAV